MSEIRNCPKCRSENVYEDRNLFVCPECGHEWEPWKPANEEAKLAEGNDDDIIRDSNGNILTDGDTVTVIKDLKIKGSSTVVKQGTTVKSIRLVGGDHDIDCKVPGVGQMKLKSEFLKKI